MGNVFGTSSSSPINSSNFVASGHGVYTNDKGETIHDSFRHVNGEFTRETSTGNLPLPNGFITPQQPGHVPWMAPVAATVMLVLFVALFIYSRQTKRSVKRSIAVIEDVEKAPHSIPLYSLNNKARPHHASDAMWNIDLLEDDLKA